jgi:hypothetical protein
MGSACRGLPRGAVGARRLGMESGDTRMASGGWMPQAMGGARPCGRKSVGREIDSSLRPIRASARGVGMPDLARPLWERVARHGGARPQGAGTPIAMPPRPPHPPASPVTATRGCTPGGTAAAPRTATQSPSAISGASRPGEPGVQRVRSTGRAERTRASSAAALRAFTTLPAPHAADSAASRPNAIPSSISDAVGLRGMVGAPKSAISRSSARSSSLQLPTCHRAVVCR